MFINIFIWVILLVRVYQLYEYLYLIFFVCTRLHFIKKICLCCFVDLQSYSNLLSTIATVSSSVISELLPACLSCDNYYIRSQSSLGFFDKTLVFEKPEAETIIQCDLGNFISLRSRVDSLPLPLAFTSKYVPFAKWNNNFLSDKLATSIS